MKKLLVFASLLALSVGCAKVEEPTSKVDPVSSNIYTLSASVAETKTTIEDSGAMMWSVGDVISVLDGESSVNANFRLKDTEATNHGTFTGTFDGSPVLAIYPYDEGNNAIVDGDYYAAEVVLKNQYDYDGTSTHAPMYAEIESTDNVSEGVAKFVHVAGLIKVVYKNVPTDATKFVFSGLDGAGITGSFTFDSENPQISVASGDDYGSTVTYVLPTMTEIQDMAFYVPAPCGTYGFSAALYNGDEKIVGSGVKVSSTTIQKGKYYIAPAIELPLPVLNTHITWSDYNDWNGCSKENTSYLGSETISLKAKPDGYSVSAKKASSSSNNPLVAKANDCRVYAGGTVTITNVKPITSIVFNLSAQGKKQTATITSDCGIVAPQSKDNNNTVSWSGSATSVTFTVGATNEYGTDSNSKSGQLCFDSIDAVCIIAGGGSEQTKNDASWDAESSVSVNERSSITVQFTTNYDGQLTVTSNDPSIATATLTNNTITITGVKKGTTTISVAGAATDNYNALSKIIAVTVGEKNLTFDLSKNPGSWPTTNSTTLTNYTFSLGGTDYTFGLKNVKSNSGYLMLTSTAVLGLPAVDGYRLTKVVAKNTGGCSTSTKVGVSSSSNTASYVTGGEVQTWSTTSSSYTYTLSGTENNTVYFLYVTNKNAQITELTLSYSPVSDEEPGTTEDE